MIRLAADRTKSAVPSSAEAAWSADVGGKLTSPVMAGGRVFVAAVDAHTVHALNADDGRRLWSFTAGARVDSAPDDSRRAGAVRLSRWLGVLPACVRWRAGLAISRRAGAASDLGLRTVGIRLAGLRQRARGTWRRLFRRRTVELPRWRCVPLRPRSANRPSDPSDPSRRPVARRVEGRRRGVLHGRREARYPRQRRLFTVHVSEPV